jgi:hypothetical protein
VLLRAAAPDTDRRLSRRGSPRIPCCGGDRGGRRDRGRRSDAERMRRGRPRNRRPRRIRTSGSWSPCRRGPRRSPPGCFAPGRCFDPDMATGPGIARAGLAAIGAWSGSRGRVARCHRRARQVRRRRARQVRRRRARDVRGGRRQGRRRAGAWAVACGDCADEGDGKQDPLEHEITPRMCPGRGEYRLDRRCRYLDPTESAVKNPTGVRSRLGCSRLAVGCPDRPIGSHREAEPTRSASVR